MWLPVLLFCLSGLVSIYLGFLRFSGEEAFDVVAYSGYWCVFMTGLLTLWALRPLCGERLASLREKWHWQDLLSLLAVLATSAYMLRSQPMEFKLHMDEPVLAATAKQMHTDRNCFFFTSGYWIQNIYYSHTGAVDKRPLLYPFLVSLIHDLTGYRVSNSFVVNALLLPIFLGVAYNFGRRLWPPYGGYLALGLFTTLPLIPLIATSGGFDLLNVTMIGLTLQVLHRYLGQPNRANQALLLLTAILLAQSRYESALFVVPVGLAILWSWWQARRIEISPVMVLVPLLLIPYALQRTIMKEFSIFWQMQGDHTEPFSLAYLGENLRHAGYYFFSTNGHLPNSLLLTVLFLAALLAVIMSGRWRDVFNGGSQQFATLGFAAMVCVNFALLMLYHWGHLDDLAVTRIAAPFLGLQVAMVVLAGRLLPFRVHRPAQWLCLAGVCIYFMVFTRPILAEYKYVPVVSSERLSDQLLELAARGQADPLKLHPLVISQASITASIAGLSSISLQTALRQLPELEWHMRLKTFDEVWILYQLNILGAPKVAGLGRFPPMQDQVEAHFERTVLEEYTTVDGYALCLARLDRIRDEVLPEASRLRPDWGASRVDYTGRMENGAVRSLEFVETLPK
jgi:hypothetical protein